MAAGPALSLRMVIPIAPRWDHLSKFIDIAIPTLPILPLIGGNSTGIDPLGLLTALSQIP